MSTTKLLTFCNNCGPARFSVLKWDCMKKPSNGFGGYRGGGKEEKEIVGEHSRSRTLLGHINSVLPVR